MALTKTAITSLLKTTDSALLNQLFSKADIVREKYIGTGIHLKGLLAISNHCSRNCYYCGLRKQNNKLERYRIPQDEIVNCAILAKKLGYGTIVLQAGEDLNISQQKMTSIVKAIKQTTGLAITLSLGERSIEELDAFKKAGADRYLLRFETSDSKLYQKIHPPKDSNTVSHPNDRINLLKAMRQMGYEIGSGIMVGIPGQTFETLTQDLFLFQTLDLDIIDSSPYIANPDTPLLKENINNKLKQVPNTELMTYKVIALARLLCQKANIPSTTALDSLNSTKAHELSLQSGANVIMPNITPIQYRRHYLIYPDKCFNNDTAEQYQSCLQKRITSIGRFITKGPGNRIK